MNSKPCRVLIISAFYPPKIHIASQRVHAFAKYLSLDDFEVHVLTLGELDASEIEQGIHVHRVRVSGFPPRFDTSGSSNRWIHRLKAAWNRAVGLVFGQADFDMQKSLVRAAQALFDSHGFSVLITSYGPTPVLNVGVQLKRHRPEVRWISDFRDEDVNTALLDDALLIADRVVTVSAPISQVMDARGLSQAPVLEIMNGYDFGELRDPEPESACFKIIFAGTFHSQSRPAVFFESLKRLVNERSLTASEVSVSILGGNSGLSIPASIRSLVTVTDRVPYGALPQALASGSALLLVLTDHSRRGVYSGKIFDYLAVNRPIIALVNPSDVAADLVSRCRAGFVGDSSSVRDSTRALIAAYDAWKAGALPRRDWSLIAQFRRSVQVSRLGDAIRQLLQ